MQKLSFSGHETFICKHFWPKKGIDFLLEGNSFNDDDAVVKLGVGKNMVSSIRFWLKALGLVDENEKPTELAELIFSDNGLDPYIEDIGTIWLLHYFLVSTDKASIYNLIFNEFTKERISFSKKNLHSFLKRITQDQQSHSYNEKTFDSDIGVFFRNYLKPGIDDIQSIEDDFSALFSDLNLLRIEGKRAIDTKLEEFYILERSEKTSLPIEILLFAIITNLKLGGTISFNELAYGNNSVGNVFLLSRDGLMEKIKQLESKYDYINFSQSGGNQVLIIKSQPDKLTILNECYGK